MGNLQPKTGLFCILARDARTAVIFRRGPSKQVLLIKWNLKNDTFEYGQWFKGRIYERRCDLSPSGEKLIYFAANWKYDRGPGSWTAVSTPPFLSAIALWPKGSSWGGGGLFETEVTISLNHRDYEMNFADGFNLDKKIKIKPLGDLSGYGEDDPIYHTRLIRDNWVLSCEGICGDPDWDRDITYIFEPPRMYQKKSPKKGRDLILQMLIKGIRQKNKPKYYIDHELITNSHDLILQLPRTSWADWDKNGDLLFAKKGKLFRLPHSKMVTTRPLEFAKELADFSELTFEAIVPPKKKLKW